MKTIFNCRIQVKRSLEAKLPQLQRYGQTLLVDEIARHNKTAAVFISPPPQIGVDRAQRGWTMPRIDGHHMTNAGIKDILDSDMKRIMYSRHAGLSHRYKYIGYGDSSAGYNPAGIVRVF